MLRAELTRLGIATQVGTSAESFIDERFQTRVQRGGLLPLPAVASW